MKQYLCIQSSKELLLICASWEIDAETSIFFFFRGHNSRETKVWRYREVSKCYSSEMAAAR